LTVSGKNFLAGDSRAKALWRGAFDDLKDAGYIERVNSTGTLWRVTNSGYQFVDAVGQEESKHPRLEISLQVSGSPEAQDLLVTASQEVELKSLDFLTSSDACVTSQALEQKGKELSVRIDHRKAAELNNTPRPDQNSYDRSGPVKLRLHLISNGRGREIVLPAVMSPQLVNNTVWITFKGSERFSL
jgi:hypothetical protein